MASTGTVAALWLTAIASAGTAAPSSTADKEPQPLSKERFADFKFRNVGPALMSGRIADIAIHPTNHSIWYVAVGSGGVWKTVNAGTTWTPIFDKQSVYSIGCITIDPSDPNIIWVGTGENVGGRHVGFGDGVYRSLDGGKNWANVGLKKSEHISKIIVHPKNSDIAWVAAQGPLWSKGGERGLYKTTDGGKKWDLVLKSGPWTGVTDLVMDPRDPDVLFAATWQHHRTVAAYVGGGPETGIYRSKDGGKTWTQLKSGLPTTSMGKIGLAISPMNPDIVYAAIELDRRKGGVWKSTDSGATWTKGAKAVGGGTGPHYYQELYASPHHFDRLYMADVQLQGSLDGGKTFKVLNHRTKHSDHHALAFRPDDPNYLMVGTDGGLYESFDLGKTWRYISNLPITQFYKVAVDDTEPFYNIYGGTQDNSTQGGPSRTRNTNGIRNADWFITLFADGHQPATEPGNPDIMYSEFQQGNLFRIDRITEEKVYIQPQPEPGQAPNRFNWDAPILVSPHSPTRIYYGSQRVWRSDNRGDTWSVLSGDLTRNQKRIELPLMDKQWGWDAGWDLYAMSEYNTITSIAESPKKEGLLYIGTDDGLIQVSENGGESWNKIEVDSLPGVPEGSFVNDIKADIFDENTVYVAIDNHKQGDYKPYLFKSTNRGRTWKSLAKNLPDNHLVWRLVQDHVAPNLLFVATEFGVFFTIDGGIEWIKLSGAPTISFRDLAIQRRENDLVAASFGRGFFVLDDYSALRAVSKKALENTATLFPARDGWWYIEEAPMGGDGQAYQGDGYYVAPNPPFGVTLSYFLNSDLQTKEEIRQKAEKKLLKKKPGASIPFPGWDAVEAERRERKPLVWLVISDEKGTPIRRIKGPTKAGMHRVTWDLRYPSGRAIGLPFPPWMGPDQKPKGHLAAPGKYSAALYVQTSEGTKAVGEPVSFAVKPLTSGALPGAKPEAIVAFWKRLESLNRSLTAAQVVLEKTQKRIEHLSEALERSQSIPAELDAELERVRLKFDDIKVQLMGQPSKTEVGEPGEDTVLSRMIVAAMGTQFSTYGPTPTHEASLKIAETEWAKRQKSLNGLLSEDLPKLEKQLLEAGAPWAPGQPIPASISR